jgi:hypothetical protein
MSALPAVNHVTLLAAFQQMLKVQLDSEAWPESERPRLVADYPREREGKYDTSFDVIVFHIFSSEIASTSRTKDQRPNGFSIFSEEPMPEKTGYKRIRYGWDEETVVQFTVYAKSAERANELVSWLHWTILTYAWGMKFFKARGVNVFEFEKRLEDRTTKDYGQELYVRPLQYRLKLGLRYTAESKLLEQLFVTVNGQALTI